MGILEAAKNGDLETIKRLLKDKPTEAKELDSDGRSALHFAAINGHTELVEWLVKNNVLPIDIKDKEGRTAFFESCFYKHWDTASVCLTNNASPNCSAKNTAPVLIAAASLQSALIKQMLSIKEEDGSLSLDLSVSLASGKNVLHLAAAAQTVCAADNVRLMKLLYDFGTTNSQDDCHSLPADYLTSCHDWCFGEDFKLYVESHPH